MRIYLYHKTKKPIIIDKVDLDQYVEWEESPLPFIKTTDCGIDPDDTNKVQSLGESVYGIRDCCNGLLNLQLMKLKELREFTKTHFSKRIKAKSKTALINKIEALNGDCSRYS
jgi:hypothetical protein